MEQLTDSGVGVLSIVYDTRVHRIYMFFFSSRRRHTRLQGDWSSDVCSSDLRRVGRRASVEVLSPAVTEAGLIHHIARTAVRTWRPRALLTLYEGHGWEKSA